MLPDSLRQPSPEERFMKWVLRFVVAGVFIGTGWAKFSNDPHSEWVEIFQRIGLGDWFRYTTGVVEMLGGALFLVPRVTAAGAGLLAATMAGATVAHLTRLGDPISCVITLGLLGGVLIAAAWVAPEKV